MIKNQKLAILVACLAMTGASVMSCNEGVQYSDCNGFEGKTICVDNAVVVCDANGESVSTPCPDGKVCVTSEEDGAICDDEKPFPKDCTEADNKCVDGKLTVCDTATGQTTESACPSGVCDGNACAQSSTKDCTEADNKCVDGKLTVCDTTTGQTTESACPSGVCDGNACAQSSTDECTNDDTKCETTSDGKVIVSKCIDKQWTPSNEDCTNKICSSDNKSCVNKPCELSTGVSIEDNAKLCVNGELVSCLNGETSSQTCENSEICPDGENACRTYKDCDADSLKHGEKACNADQNVAECVDGTVKVTDCVKDDLKCSSALLCEAPNADDCELGNAIVVNGNKVCDANILRTCTNSVLSDDASSTICQDDTPICDEAELACRAYKQCDIGTDAEPQLVEHEGTVCNTENTQKLVCHDGVMTALKPGEDDGACVDHQICVEDDTEVKCVCDEDKHWTANTTGTGDACVCATGWSGNDCDVATESNSQYCTTDACDNLTVKQCDTEHKLWSGTKACEYAGENGSATCTGNGVCGISCDTGNYLSDSNVCTHDCTATTYENNASNQCVVTVCSSDGHISAPETKTVSCNATNTGVGDCLNGAKQCSSDGSKALVCANGKWTESGACAYGCDGVNENLVCYTSPTCSGTDPAKYHCGAAPDYSTWGCAAGADATASGTCTIKCDQGASLLKNSVCAPKCTFVSINDSKAEIECTYPVSFSGMAYGSLFKDVTVYCTSSSDTTSAINNWKKSSLTYSVLRNGYVVFSGSSSSLFSAGNNSCVVYANVNDNVGGFVSVSTSPYALSDTTSLTLNTTLNGIKNSGSYVKAHGYCSCPSAPSHGSWKCDDTTNYQCELQCNSDYTLNADKSACIARSCTTDGIAFCGNAPKHAYWTCEEDTCQIRCNSPYAVNPNTNSCVVPEAMGCSGNDTMSCNYWHSPDKGTWSCVNDTCTLSCADGYKVDDYDCVFSKSCTSASSCGNAPTGGSWACKNSLCALTCDATKGFELSALGDNCQCKQGTKLNNGTCQTTCGNSVLDDGEECDGVEGCTTDCKAKAGWDCRSEANFCIERP